MNTRPAVPYAFLAAMLIVAFALATLGLLGGWQ